MSATRNLHSGNCDLLARIKRQFNAAFYARCRAALNEGRGIEGVRVVLAGFLKPEAVEHFLAHKAD
jgi:hypothetical protein